MKNLKSAIQRHHRSWLVCVWEICRTSGGVWLWHECWLLENTPGWKTQLWNAWNKRVFSSHHNGKKAFNFFFHLECSYFHKISFFIWESGLGFKANWHLHLVQILKSTQEASNEHRGLSSLIHFEILHQAFMFNYFEISSSSVKSWCRDLVGSNISA